MKIKTSIAITIQYNQARAAMSIIKDISHGQIISTHQIICKGSKYICLNIKIQMTRTR